MRKPKIDKKKATKTAKRILGNAMGLFAEIEGIELNQPSQPTRTPKPTKTKKTKTKHKTKKTRQKTKKTKRKAPKPITITEIYLVEHGKHKKYFTNFNEALRYARRLAREEDTQIITDYA